VAHPQLLTSTDQHGARSTTFVDEGNRSDDREVAVVHHPQQAILVLRQPDWQFLECIELIVILNEADDVAM